MTHSPLELSLSGVAEIDTEESNLIMEKEMSARNKCKSLLNVLAALVLTDLTGSLHSQT